MLVLVFAFNKWDLIERPQETLAELREKTERLLPQVRGLLAVPVSAETGRGLDKLMDAILKTHKVWNSRVSTGRLNRWLEGVLDREYLQRWAAHLELERLLEEAQHD